MEIAISGICCWVDSRSPKNGKTVIIRNALGGGAHRGSVIPPHFAFIHAKRDQVDARNWPVGWAGSDDNVFFYLTGDFLSIDPVPSGGSIDISRLPHVAARTTAEPICPAAGAIRDGFRDDPSTTKVLGLLELPADADVYSIRNDRGAAYAILRMPQTPVSITATPFPDSDGVPRSLVIEDPNARVAIVNVNMPEYILGVGASDDDHQYLVCEIFKPESISDEALAVSDRSCAAATLSVAEAQESELDHVTLTALRRAAQRQMPKFLSTLAAGCSATQWP